MNIRSHCVRVELFHYPSIARSLTMDATNNSTIIPGEIVQFSEMAASWSTLTVLESQNEKRIPIIIKGLVDTGRITQAAVKGDTPLTGLQILDVGCGGGFLSEPLAKLGAQITALDPCLKLIEYAREHIKDREDIRDRVQYIHGSIEDFCKRNLNKYDHVVAAEVLDHIQRRDLFVASCVKALKPGGTMFVSTINRTLRSWLRMVLYYEYMLGIIPRGTHHWHMFVTPDEAKAWFEENNCEILSLEGYCLQSNSTWTKINHTSSSYFMQVVKKY